MSQINVLVRVLVRSEGEDHFHRGFRASFTQSRRHKPNVSAPDPHCDFLVLCSIGGARSIDAASLAPCRFVVHAFGAGCPSTTLPNPLTYTPALAYRDYEFPWCRLE